MENDPNNPSLSSNTQELEDEILSQMIAAMRRLSIESRKKILQVLATHFEIQFGETSQQLNHIQSPAQRPSSYSEDRSISPKEFLLEKSPKTDIERVACLAYFLTYYRDTPQFKTLDISKLNTEAAQIKFSNAAKAVDNAAAQVGFLVQATKGNKQLSSVGELYVQALPDREAAKIAIANIRPRKKSKKNIPN